MKTEARNREHGRSTVLGKELFIGYMPMSPERVSVGEEVGGGGGGGDGSGGGGGGGSFHVDEPEAK